MIVTTDYLMGEYPHIDHLVLGLILKDISKQYQTDILYILANQSEFSTTQQLTQQSRQEFQSIYQSQAHVVDVGKMTPNIDARYVSHNTKQPQGDNLIVEILAHPDDEFGYWQLRKILANPLLI